MEVVVCAERSSAASYTHAIEGLRKLADLQFERVEKRLRRDVYSVPYIQLEDESGGKLWVTRHGWHHLMDLEPERWFAGKQYRKNGRRLNDGSGAVYRYQNPDAERNCIPLVVKFSRFAQDVQFGGCAALSTGVPPECLDTLIFNDPFQEFGLVEELRQSEYGPRDLRILTKRPLAIYSPGTSFEAWQLGRSADAFLRHQRQLETDQRTQTIPLGPKDFSIERQYIMLYHWVRGVDAESLIRRGILSVSDANELVRQVHREMSQKGFRVLDTKPSHIILRNRNDRGLVRHKSRVAYAMVDFELLQRTKGYAQWRDM